MRYYQVQRQKHSSGPAEWHSRSDQLRALGRGLLRKATKENVRELLRELELPTSKKEEEKANVSF